MKNIKSGTQNMASLSLCMIVKNEQKVLDRCLKSCKGLFDEIIIVDTGSTDQTKILAQKYTQKVFDFAWQNDFSLARNYAFSLATCDYIMWLDADDIIPQTSLKKLIKLKGELKKLNLDAVMLRYDTAFDSTNLPTFSFYRERIVKKNVHFLWIDPVHEVIDISGKIERFDIAIEHRKIQQKKYSKRNLKIYQSLKKSGKVLNARQTFYYARELMYCGKTKTAIREFKNFISMPTAWTENLISACIDLSQCYKLLGDFDSALMSLFLSFRFDCPRGEVCCLIGDEFLRQNNLKSAVFWFEQALKTKPNMSSGAFVQPKYYGEYPATQLCVIHFKLGNKNLSCHYNNLVGKFNPQNESYLANKKFFDMQNRD